MNDSDLSGNPGTALDLLRRWRAHKNDSCASITTLISVFGLHSAIGAYADKFAYNNPPYSCWLAEIALSSGATTLEICNVRKTTHSDTECLRSIAAQRMCLNELHRTSARRVRMTQTTHLALVSYYQERLALLREIKQIVEDGCYQAQVERHIRATERLLRSISAAVPTSDDDPFKK